MLGTSDTWSMSCLSQQPSDPAYYIEDCRICRLELDTNYQIRTLHYETPQLRSYLLMLAPSLVYKVEMRKIEAVNPPTPLGV